MNGKRVEAQPKLKGTCLSCGGGMVAKCRTVKVWHWSLKGHPLCDPWWKSEAKWHRYWKNKFPLEWQEIAAFDPATGEKHIADIKTPYGLVVELQHSPITPAEIQARRPAIWEVAQTNGWFRDNVAPRERPLSAHIAAGQFRIAQVAGSQSSCP